MIQRTAPAAATFLFLAAIHGAALAEPPTLAPGKADPVVKSEPGGLSPVLVSNTYRLIKNHYIPFDGDYAPLRSFDPTRPSSRGVTVEEVQQASTKNVREAVTKLLFIDRTIQMSAIEAQAVAYPLPNMAPGNYGYILGGKVQKVVDKDTLILSDIELIDATELQRAREEAVKSAQEAAKRNPNRKGSSSSDSEQERRIEKSFDQRTRLADQQRDSSFKSRVRLHGFSTDNALERAQWTGPLRAGSKPVANADPAGPANSPLQIAIVGVGYEDDKRDPKKPEPTPTPTHSASGSASSKISVGVGGSGSTSSSSGSASGKPASHRSGRKVFEAVPLEWFRKGITEEQFRDLVEKRGVPMQDLVELAQKEVRRDPANAAELVVDMLERNRKDDPGK